MIIIIIYNLKMINASHCNDKLYLNNTGRSQKMTKLLLPFRIISIIWIIDLPLKLNTFFFIKKAKMLLHTRRVPHNSIEMVHIHNIPT